jgi:rhodanese-related sulfurtransferase
MRTAEAAEATAHVTNAISLENGDPEVSAHWVANHRNDFRFIDVREPHELTGPLGQVEDIENVPLLKLLGATQLDPNEPLVLICRSGRRSGLAARELKARGVATVASVEGGMMAWNLDVMGIAGIHEMERLANTTNLDDAIRTINGVPEVNADWVHANLGRFTLVDVREPGELRSTGWVPQAVNRPLQSFLAEAETMNRANPIVVMCASGGRSGRAVRALVGAGFQHVASMEGGMYGWRLGGFPHA